MMSETNMDAICNIDILSSLLSIIIDFVISSLKCVNKKKKYISSYM